MNTGIWVLIFFIAILFFIMICQCSNKSTYGGYIPVTPLPEYKLI